MKLSSLKRDPASIEAGQWVGEIPTMGSLRLHVRGMSSLSFQAAFGRLSRAVPKEDRQRDGSLNPDVAARVLGEALHETVLLDWEGLVDDDDKPKPYDAETAMELLTNPEWRLFADAVVWAAGVVDNSRQEAAEALGKNSKPSSPGN